MEILKFKIPLLMFSETELDSKGNCLERVMEEVEDISEVKGVERLSGQYCWIYDYSSNFSKPEDVEEGFAFEKKHHGFNLREVVMDVRFEKGYYVAEFLSDLPLDSKVTVSDGCPWEKEVTLKEAITDFLEANLSDGIGENEIGKVHYNFTDHEVWLGLAEEIE